MGNFPVLCRTPYVLSLWFNSLFVPNVHRSSRPVQWKHLQLPF